MKIELIQEEGGAIAVFECPGCREPHGQHIRPYANAIGASWLWNESLEAPTFAPSIVVRREYTDPFRPPKVCHSFVQDGKIQFLGDCTHELAGQTVELPEVDNG
jgi:hypothetical protein